MVTRYYLSKKFSLSINPLGQNTPHRACISEPLASLGIAGTAFLREITDDIQHKRNIGLITHEAAFAFHIHQPAMHNGLEMKRKVGGRDIKLSGNIALHKAARRVFDQQPEYIQPHVGGKSLKNFACLSCLHRLIVQHYLIYVKRATLGQVMPTGMRHSTRFPPNSETPPGSIPLKESSYVLQDLKSLVGRSFLGDIQPTGRRGLQGHVAKMGVFAKAGGSMKIGSAHAAPRQLRRSGFSAHCICSPTRASCVFQKTFSQCIADIVLLNGIRWMLQHGKNGHFRPPCPVFRHPGWKKYAIGL